MDRTHKRLAIVMACGFLVQILCPCGQSEAGIMELGFRGNYISADLDEVPLKSILTRIEKERNIWYQGSESVLEKKVSVSSREMPFRDAVTRILWGMNYSLIFNHKNELKGVVLLGGTGNPKMGKSNRTWSEEGVSERDAGSEEGYDPSEE